MKQKKLELEVIGFLFTASDLSNLVNSCEMKLSGSLNFWGL